MGSMNLPITRTCSSAHNIIEELFTKKRCRKKLDMSMNEEEQEEEYLQAREVKRRIIPQEEDELARLMMNMNLPFGRVQGEREQDTAAIQSYTPKRKLTYLHEHEVEDEKTIRFKRQKILEHIGKKIDALRITTTEESGKSYNRDVKSLPTDVVLLILDKLLESIDHARFAVVCDEWKSLAKLYKCEKKPWLKVFPPMLWVAAQSHGSGDPTTMLYSLSERKIYRNIKLPAPSDDRIYCNYGWMAELSFDTTSLGSASLAITLMNPFRKAITTLMNPFRNESDTIRLPLIHNSMYHATQDVKIILPTDPTLDRENYMVLAICGLKLFFIGGGQNFWRLTHNRCSAATYYKGRVFAVEGVARHHPRHQLVSYRIESIDGDDTGYKVLASLEDCTQAYFATSTKGDLLVVVRLLLNRFDKRKMAFKVFKWFDSTTELAEVDNIEDEVVFVGNSQSVCVLASKFPGCRPNSIYYANDRVAEQQRLEDIGIFYLEDASHRTIKQHYSLELPDTARAAWITPTFPVLN